jgi:acetolactate synthase-1/2/3 large subunit
MKASDLLVKALENEGVEYIFGVPGEENLDLIESLSSSSIKFITTRHEQSAGFIAAIVGRLSGKPGVCLTTLGPGATNAMTSVAYAYLGGMPCLFITGQKPIKESKQAHFQILDIVEMMKPITKSAIQITDANNIPSQIREAFRLAVREKPGPTHIELPEDIAGEEASTEVYRIINVEPPSASEETINKVVKKINSAQRPLVLIASGADRHDIHEAVNSFLQKSGLYFFTTQMGKGVVDENSERCLGTAAMSEGDIVHKAIEEADLIINLGHDLSEKPPFLMSDNGPEVLHINYESAKVNEVYFPQTEVLGCLKTNLLNLTKSIKERANPIDCFQNVKKQIEDEIYSKKFDSTFPLNLGFVVQELNHLLSENSILSLDNGLYKLWFARNFRANWTHHLLLDNALATMGAGLPVAIASKIVYPDKNVIAICGDGGLMMNSQELETAVRLKLDLIVIVLKDDAYGMIKWKQDKDGFEDYALDFGTMDFVTHAESFGATGHRVEKADDLKMILNFCKSKAGVHLIEVPIKYGTELFQ